MNPVALLKRYKVMLASALFLTLFFLVYLSPSMFVYVYPGQAGLLFRALADDPLGDRVYREGLYVIAPWNRMYVYDVTEQKRTVEADALTSNGLFVTVRASALFHPDATQLKALAVHMGPDYIDKLVVPRLYASVRRVVGGYTPEALYTTARDVLHDAVLAETIRELEGLPFEVEDVIVEKIAIPETISAAVERKLEQQQEALGYQFRLAKQQDEAKRMKIEAEGLRDYQAIVGSNLTPDLIEWLRIRALHDLADGEGSRVIVLGDGKAMPLLLDGGDGTSQ